MNQYKSSCLLDGTIIFLEQRDNRINLLVWFIKHRQLVPQVGDSHALSFVEKEAIAPRTIGLLAHGMARGDHIRHENYEFISVEGPPPTSTHGYDPNLYHRDPGHVAYSGHTLETTSGGSILEFTYLEGLVPSLIAGCGQVS